MREQFERHGRRLLSAGEVIQPTGGIVTAVGITRHMATKEVFICLQ